MKELKKVVDQNNSTIASIIGEASKLAAQEILHAHQAEQIQGALMNFAFDILGAYEHYERAKNTETVYREAILSGTQESPEQIAAFNLIPINACRQLFEGLRQSIFSNEPAHPATLGEFKAAQFNLGFEMYPMFQHIGGEPFVLGLVTSILAENDDDVQGLNPFKGLAHDESILKSILYNQGAELGEVVPIMSEYDIKNFVSQSNNE